MGARKGRYSAWSHYVTDTHTGYDVANTWIEGRKRHEREALACRIARLLNADERAKASKRKAKV